MNFLQLVNSLREKCGVSGTALTDVTGQTGESLRLVDWINDAWMDVQQEHDNWKFLRASFTFTTTNGQQTYTPAQANTVNFSNWKINPNTLRIYQTSIGYSNEIWLPRWDYEYFRDLYLFGAMRSNSSRPVVYTIDDSKNLLLGPIPNSLGYTVIGDYYKVATELSANTDIPALPVQFHRIIVYRAMMYYGGFDAASETFQTGEREYKKMMSLLELDQLAAIDLGDPLV